MFGSSDAAFISVFLASFDCVITGVHALFYNASKYQYRVWGIAPSEFESLWLVKVFLALSSRLFDA